MNSPTLQSHRSRARPSRPALTAALALGVTGALVTPAQAQAFDLDRGNAVVEVVIPNVLPVLFANVAPGDASLVLRTTTLLTNTAFDAIAPYNASALGVYSRLPRRPASDGLTDRNRNVAILYASLPVLNSLYPTEQARWSTMLTAAGVDPAVASTDLTTPQGLGRATGLAVVAARENDGMNQLGNAGGRQFHRVPYADTTGYRPLNTAYELTDPSRWQPAVTSRGNGIFSVQQFVTPQWALTEPYSYRSPERLRVPPPVNSNPNGPGGRQRYKQQVDQVLAASAALTDERKLAAELFNNKIESLGFVALFLSQWQRWNVEQLVQYDFMVNLAAFDGGIAVWREKARHDAVRPATAARYLYGDGMVTAWGGPGRGTVNLPTDQWRSYLDVADHPEYPSGSSCFCSAHAQASRRFLGSDALGWTVAYARGSSRVEPGVTPANDTALTFETWTKFETVCGDSRVWGGVHFQAAVEASKPMCTRIGDRAWRFVSRHIAGQVPAEVGLRDDNDESLPVIAEEITSKESRRRNNCVDRVQNRAATECPFMNTSSHLVRRACLAGFTAAATSAFAQAPTCTAPPGPDCLYVAPATYGFTSFERNVVYTDITGSQRVVKLLIRQPLGATLPMPVAIWSHGGTDGKNDPATSMAEWGTVSARAGYSSISIAHAHRDESSRLALCQAIGMDNAACNMFSHLNWDRPHDIRAVLDEVDRLAAGELRGQIDNHRIAVGGHSAGSGGAQTIAGAQRSFMRPPGTISDPRPIAFLALSPQQPGSSGFFDTRFQQPAHSWTDVQRPMLTATGDGDDTCKPSDVPGQCIGDTPFGRRIGFQRMPATGDKYHLYIHDADAFHMLFELNASKCAEKNVDAAKCNEIVRWLSSTALAFLDWHVRQVPAAQQWLQSDRIERASRGVAEWQRK